MEYLYAALLLHRAGKEINEENVKKVLEAAGVSVDDAKVKALVSALEGVNIDEAISKASTVAVAAPAAAPAAGGSEAPAQKEEAKEEKKEEKSEEEAVAGLGALFG